MIRIFFISNGGDVTITNVNVNIGNLVRSSELKPLSKLSVHSRLTKCMKNIEAKIKAGLLLKNFLNLNLSCPSASQLIIRRA